MKHAEQIRLIELLLQRLDAGTNVDAGAFVHNPNEVYRSPEIAAREWDTFFRNHTQLIGLSGDLPESGSFLTRSDFGVPVLATRDAQGRFRAFVNVCRHRGVVVEGEPHGTRSRFVCPFHGWTYDGEGALVAVPKESHFGTVDKSCLGLTPLPAEERHGFLWVHPQPDGVLDLDTQLGDLNEEFETWNFGRYRAMGSDTYEKRMNWKLGNDTFGETYHFKVLHRDTLAQDFHGNVQTYDIFGRNHRMGLCFKAIEELRREPRENWHISRAALPVYYLFPNVQLNVLPGNLALVRFYPDRADPARSIARVNFYASPEAIEMGGEDIRNIPLGFGEIIRDEDFEIAALSQIGADCGVHDYVVFGRNEPALHHYHNTFREALGMPLLERLDEA